MQNQQDERSQIIASFQAGWNELLAEFENCQSPMFEQPATIGHWSVKDLMGHIESWDRIATANLETRERGLEPEEEPDNIDAFNEQMAEPKRARTFEDVWDEMLRTHEQYLERLSTSSILTAELIASDIEHYRDHAADVRRARLVMQPTAVTEQERENILAVVHRNWDELIAVLRGFSREELDIPNVIGIWTLKDLIGHLETWDRISIKTIRLAETGRAEPWWKVEGLQHRNIDEFNEADADRKRSRELEQLWQELHDTHDELVALLEVTPVLSRDLIRVDTYDHYADHLNDIRLWQARRQ